MIRRKDREILRAIYVMQCGYCGLSEADYGAKLTIDHFKPASEGGDDDVENLVYACHACNEFKGDYWSEEEHLRLLHPLNDFLDSHLREDDTGLIIALSALGEVYIQTLRLNRAPLVVHRQRRRQVSKLIQNQDWLKQHLIQRAKQLYRVGQRRIKSKHKPR